MALVARLKWDSARVFADGKRPGAIRWFAPLGDGHFVVCEPTTDFHWQLLLAWEKPEPGKLVMGEVVSVGPELAPSKRGGALVLRGVRQRGAPVDWTPYVSGAWAKRGTPPGTSLLGSRFSGVLERKSSGHFWVTLATPVEVRAVTLAASASGAAGLAVHAEWIGIGPYRNRFSLSVVDPRGRLTDPEALEFEVRAVVPGADVTEPVGET